MAIDNALLQQSLNNAKRWSLSGRTLVFANPKDGKVIYQTNRGPQSDVQWRPEFEVLCGGSRGGGKSVALMIWMVRGNFDLPQDHPCHATVLNHPKFSGLILRRNAVDLEEFIETARPFYELLGGKATGKPTIFEWKHGPRIYTNHLDSPEAFEKYRGWSLARIGIEELTQIEQLSAYLKVLSSCRTPYAELRPAWSDGVGQVLATTNPDGPGSSWVNDRFVEVIGKNGQLIPWGTTIKDRLTGLTRVFIPARLKDNPYLGESYRSALMLQAAADPALVAAWLDGEWGTTSGTYFKNFRPNGPREGEPEAARHVIKAGSVSLMPWWRRSIGVDWGLADEAAALWGCFNQSDERIHIYRELVVNGQTGRIMGTEEFGAEIARLSMADLAGQNDQTITLWLDWSCFSKTDLGKTKADQIIAGIERILGAGSVIVANAGGSAEDIQRYEEDFDGRAKIVVRPSTRLREDGWQYIRGLMRFTPIEPVGEPNQEYALSLLNEPDGFNKYEAYMRAFKKQKAEVLPGLLIWDCCPKLIKQLKDAIHDEKHPDDIWQGRTNGHHWDVADCARYLLFGMKRELETMPKYAYLQERMSHAPEYVISDPTIYAQVMRKAEADYAKKHAAPPPMRLPRLSVN